MERAKGNWMEMDVSSSGGRRFLFWFLGFLAVSKVWDFIEAPRLDRNWVPIVGGILSAYFIAFLFYPRRVNVGPE